jgi:hypothetical protein
MKPNLLGRMAAWTAYAGCGAAMMYAARGVTDEASLKMGAFFLGMEGTRHVVRSFRGKESSLLSNVILPTVLATGLVYGVERTLTTEGPHTFDATECSSSLAGTVEYKEGRSLLPFLKPISGMSVDTTTRDWFAHDSENFTPIRSPGNLPKASFETAGVSENGVLTLYYLPEDKGISEYAVEIKRVNNECNLLKNCLKNKL